MKPNIPLARYKFTYQAIDPVSLPAFADPLWRSVFGLALKQLSCIAEDTQLNQCDSCMLRYQCDYSFLTTGPNPPGEKAGITKGMKSIPNPHLFHGEIRDYTVKIPKGATFSTHLVLIGNANERLPAVIRAMVQVGMLGLGGRRSKLRLLEVSQVGPEPLPRLIMANQTILASGRPGPIAPPDPPEAIRFSFITPYLMPSNIPVEEGFDAARLFMQIVRRVSSLHEPYTGTPLEVDFRHLKSLAQIPTILETDLEVRKGYSYASNRKKFIAVRGSFVVSLTTIEELWPWLYLGQWLNVGKLGSKGFGRYSLTETDVGES